MESEEKEVKGKTEGSRIELVLREAYPGTSRMAHPSRRLIICASNPPIEAFEMLFPRYQLESYRGISLGRWNNYDFFARHRWSGLSISYFMNSEGGAAIQSMYRTSASKALRHVNKRDPEYLGEEADFILTKVIPDMKPAHSFTRESVLNWELAAKELSLAFEHLREKGIIK